MDIANTIMEAFSTATANETAPDVSIAAIVYYTYCWYNTGLPCSTANL